MRVFKCVLSLVAMAPTLLCVSASAATKCVNSNGSMPCYSTIGAAVAAASAGDVIQVAGGTYHESVTITKPVSLSSDGSATIDATGMPRGIFVNGYTNPGLSGVNISGFTVRNAMYEGILVLNASMVNVSNNTVMNNDRSLSNALCPGLDGFETNEQSDCGEGIHLMAADHSIVTNNTVQGNSGGILLSDDTGATHDNLISFNTVINNPYACGITLASHPAFNVDLTSSPGVYHNTVYGNRAKNNGSANGGGAGVGIYASVPGAASYGNVVVDNYLADNGLPGIAMHAHAPNQRMTDNMLVGNTIANNAADTEDAYTPGPTGINIYSLTPQTGNIASGNQIQNETVAVAVNVPAMVQVQNNALNAGIGVWDPGVGAVNGAENWWSCPSGPSGAGGCASVQGASVSYWPWLTTPIPGQPNY